MYEYITLCYRCADNYRAAGYEIKRDYTEQYKDECDICRRTGWVYKIWRKKHHVVVASSCPDVSSDEET